MYRQFLLLFLTVLLIFPIDSRLFDYPIQVFNPVATVPVFQDKLLSLKWLQAMSKFVCHA